MQDLEKEKSLLSHYNILKLNFFEFIFLLLRDDNTTYIWVCLLASIQFFQSLYYFFCAQMAEIWQSSKIIVKLDDIIGYVHIAYYIRQSSSSFYYMILFIILGLIFLEVISFFFVSYLINLQKNVHLLILRPIRYLCMFMNTILFIPIVELLITINVCDTDSKSGISQNIYFKDVECWKGTHIGVAGASIFGLIIYLAFNTIYSFLYFDGLCLELKGKNKKNGRATFFYNLNQFLIIVLFNFLNKNTYQLILIIYMIFGYFVVFLHLHYFSPYTFIFVRKFFKVISCLAVWNSFMILVAKVVEGILFQGSIYAWFFSCPLIIILEFTTTNKDIKYILMTSTKFSSPKQVEGHTRMILHLIHEDMKKGSEGRLLWGFVSTHKQICNDVGCPLQRIMLRHSKEQSRNVINLIAVNKEKIYTIIWEYMSSVYTNSTSKFRKNLQLKIDYAVFLSRTMKHRQAGLVQIEQAEQLNPKIDEEFNLFQIKKSIEMDISEQDDNGEKELDFTELKEFDELFFSFREILERSVLLLMEIWLQLGEEKPDILKIQDMGSRLPFLKKIIDTVWNRLSHMKTVSLIKAQKLYSWYLIEIFNHKEDGLKILEESKTLENFFKRKKTRGVMDGDIENQEESLVFMTLDELKFGNIYGITATAGKLFGYTKTEIVNSNIDTLMPSIYGKYHEEFLRNYTIKNESKILNVQRFVFGKHKSDYIFPCYILVQPIVNSIKQNIDFVGSFTQHKSLKEIGYLIYNQEGMIEDISASCITLLGFTNRFIRKNKIRLDKIFPEIEKDTNNLYSKTGQLCEYNFSDLLKAYSTDNQMKTYLKTTETGEKTILDINVRTANLFICHAFDIKFSNEHQPGSYLRIEPIYSSDDKEKQEIKKDYTLATNSSIYSLKKKLNMTMKNNDKSPKKDVFQFKFNPTSYVYLGETNENLAYTQVIDNRIDESSYISNNDNTILEASYIDEIKSLREKFDEANKSVNEEESKIEGINYAQGIRLYKLIKNTLIDNDKFVEDQSLLYTDEEDAEKKEDSISLGSKKNEEEELDEDDDENEGKIDNLIKSQKQLNIELNKKDDTSATKFLKRLSFTMMVIIMLLSILGYYFKITQTSSIKECINVIYYSSKKLSLIQEINLYIRNLVFLNKGYLLPSNTSTEIKEFELKMRQGIENSLTEFDLVNEEIQFSSLYNKVEQSEVPMFFRENDGYALFDLNQATEQLITKAYYIRNMPLSDILFERSEVYFLLYNSMNDYYLILSENMDILMHLMEDMNSEIMKIALIFLSASISIICFLSLLNTFFFQKAYKIKEQILSVFLEIPQKTAKLLYSKCENFLINISSGDGDEFLFNDVDGDEMKNMESSLNPTGGQGGQDFFGKAKKKKFKNHEKKYIGFFLRLVSVVCTITGYYLLDFFTGKLYTDKIDGLMVEFNSTFVSENFYGYILNSEKLMFFDQNLPISKINSYQYLKSNYNKVYDIEALILKEHAFNRVIHDTNYDKIFDIIKSIGPCELIGTEGFGSIQDCDVFSHGNVNEGMSNGVMHHFQHLYYMIGLFEDIENNKNINWPPNFMVKNFTNNTRQNNIYNIFGLNDFLETDNMQILYIHFSYQYLKLNFKKQMISFMESFESHRMIILISFLLGFLFAFIFIWSPYISRISRDIWYTRSLLGIIPLSEIKRIKSINRFIKKFIIEKQL